MNKTLQLFFNYQNLLSPDTTGLLKLKKATRRLNQYFERAREKNLKEHNASQNFRAAGIF